jgi:hypothetical protein
VFEWARSEDMWPSDTGNWKPGARLAASDKELRRCPECGLTGFHSWCDRCKKMTRGTGVLEGDYPEELGVADEQILEELGITWVPPR